MVSLRTFGAPLIVSLACSFTAAQADWPQFRGPTAQGHADVARLPLHWNESTHVTWKTEIPGLAWSSPVVVGGRIYLTTAIAAAAPKGTSDHPTIELGAMCLDAASGEPVWHRAVFVQEGPVEIHTKNSHASPTPLVEGDSLYIHFGPHGTACLSLDGTVRWKQSLPYSPTHGNGGSPALAGDVLVMCCDGSDVQYVVGLDKTSGSIRWKTDRDTSPARGFSFCTPLILNIGGTMQAVCPGSDAVFAYDAASGKEVWRVEYPGGYSVIPRPVYGHGLVYVCTGYNRPTLLAIDPTGTGNVTATHVRWQTDRHVPHSSSLLLVDDMLFFVSDKGIARCVNALTGEQHWEQRLGGNYSASPLYAQGRVYFQDELGTSTVIEASQTFRRLAQNTLNPDERTFASYAALDGALILRSERHLYRIEE